MEDGAESHSSCLEIQPPVMLMVQQRLLFRRMDQQQNYAERVCGSCVHLVYIIFRIYIVEFY